jgi:hypothetical protein
MERIKPSEILERFRLPSHVEKMLSSYGEFGVIFFTEPNSSNLAWLWSFFMGFCTVMNVVFLILSSMDGPNNYEDRANMSTYPTLLNYQVSLTPPSPFLLLVLLLPLLLLPSHSNIVSRLPSSGHQCSLMLS